MVIFCSNVFRNALVDVEKKLQMTSSIYNLQLYGIFNICLEIKKGLRTLLLVFEQGFI